MTPNMVTGAAKLYRSGPLFHYCLFRFTSLHRYSSLPPVEEALKAAVEVKMYQKIPDLLSSKEAVKNPNPFSFLSTFPRNIRMQIIDEILQSFIPLRPRFRPRIAYACLLSYTLQSPKPLPLALAILQRMLYSGCIPVPQIHLLLSSAWLERRCQSECVPNILLEMQSIGYRPDCGTCNYLISSLCRVDQLVEAVKVLKGMVGAGCVPDLESYDIVIGAMSTVRKTNDATDMLKEMVAKMGLMPRQATVVKVAVALRANREIWKAVEMIEFLEREGTAVGFDSYEVVVEGCLECSEYILAGKVAMVMAERGFLPHIKVRQKVVERLAGIGEWELACTVRQRFSELRS
ncbi:pentatricopeptide repeat-containing protein At1g06270 [Juglans microcarpa x Juglans regia]|uniref:pentatricopeptide repeat-containing protein At1g06270 n=1 Tax=Juglans microcarpa x Juglans regia TaxID=2249226 RepID=UPI001B7D9E88|nr:pentatricopeptide repeat-containing protein At1g06270 [Juglans microcarpa x Juglans regia]XP_041007079.1 pentatricopeptide repeat-containing protein At1g06270 [Juglans microcarpa x Juglans regia]XP_041007080.1 pentatricopeptide repeat-containing protein At1g06270 [Juglans microcarpa x Juglans regia]XP_041007081.1 pentatricopeptide repeat-containing protein At1g06270 [Juglans microcarpa x Juglans regia]XP_041007082.1 pentatricopeptide repeat-containing protein At1g06270 [Juglans microcarpa x 